MKQFHVDVSVPAGVVNLHLVVTQMTFDLDCHYQIFPKMTMIFSSKIYFFSGKF